MLVIASEPLLIPRCPDRRQAPEFFEEVDVLDSSSWLLLFQIRIRQHPRGFEGNFGGEDHFCLIHEDERGFTRGPTGRGLGLPQGRRELIHPMLATFLEPVKGACLKSL